VKILVTAKRLMDPETKVRLKKDNSGVETDGVKFVVNPFDENAIEEALRLKEKNAGSEVVVMSIGKPEVVEQIRTGLAMGGDRGIHINTTAEVDSDAVARLVAKIVEQEKPDLVLMGKQAVDDDASQAPQLLAEYLGWAQACFASKVEIAGTTATVTREVDGGLEVLELGLPCIISADLRLNEPRYASLPGIMKAKKKEVKEFTPEALGVDVAPKVKTVSAAMPPARSAGKKVESVQELVNLLRTEAKVL
jgi:electron transfer flavoprotein beta subunit